MRALPFLPALLALLPIPALAVPCGGSFDSFLALVAEEAKAEGLPPDAVDSFLAGARQDPAVLKADRAQGVFRKPFTEFTQWMISEERLAEAQARATEFDTILSRAEKDYGVPRGILLAFWAFETDFGRIQGDFSTRDALLTLAHDCRRPDLFQPQVLAAIKLFAQKEFPLDTTGAWAGEIGMVQMLPRDIIERGVDGDGDGVIALKTSPADALLSGANMLRHHGWRADEPWLVEVTLPDTFDWALTGLDTEMPVEQWVSMGVLLRGAAPAPGLSASILLPQGRKGPAFLAFDNYRSLFQWNQSFVYVSTAAYFATLVDGAAPFNPGSPDPQLSLEEMKDLQARLTLLGHDVGQIDGILGAGTRAAIQAEQERLGLPADAWPTRELLDRL